MERKEIVKRQGQKRVDWRRRARLLNSKASINCERRHVELANGRIKIERLVHGKRAVKITRSAIVQYGRVRYTGWVNWHRHVRGSCVRGTPVKGNWQGSR